MNQVFLAAAHSKDAPLPALVAEIRDIEKILSPLQQQKRLEVRTNRAANVEDIFTTFSQHQTIEIFHYAGHADDTTLYLEEAGKIQGIAQLFGLKRAEGSPWNPLRLVFLNGCASQGQVADLHAAGIAAVIATSRSIHDSLAVLFATTFYQTWALEGKKLVDAFLTARARVNARTEEAEIEMTSRQLALRETKAYHDPVPWGLYLHPDLDDPGQIEHWVLNEPPKLPPMQLVAVKPRVTQNLLELVHEFRKMVRTQSGRTERKDPLMMLIERLPWTVGTHLRRLFAVDSDRSILQPNLERLRELITAYSDLTQFISYLALSMLWDSRRKQQAEYPEQTFEPLPFALIPDRDEYRSTDYIYRIKVYHERLRSTGQALLDPIGLMAPIGTFLDKLESDQDLRPAYLFMEGLKQAMAHGQSSLEELIRSRTTGQSDGLSALVLETEAIYARFLKALLFLTDYRLHTVRSIVVDKLRNLEYERPYSHYTMSLHAAFSQLQPMLTERDTATDSYCLLLTQRADQDALAEAMNLSPFYFDRSSYIGNNTRDYPAIFTLDYQMQEGFDAHYCFHYLDSDVNHQYAFAQDHELVVTPFGALPPDHLEVDYESQARFERLHLQLQQLVQDIPQKYPENQ